MRLFVITPIYATTTEGDGATPVVHYFTREWVKMGHEVTVFHLQARFPRPYYWISKMFQHQLNSKLGVLVPTQHPKDENYVVENVKVHRRAIKKFKPHTRYDRANIGCIVNQIKQACEENGIPDYFIGHWDNPCLDVLPALKETYKRPIVVVFHDNEFRFEGRYGSGVVETLETIDVIGFRSKVAQENFEEKYFKPKHSFICYSGVSEAFLSSGESFAKEYSGLVTKFIYVGSMIAQKHTNRLYDALCRAYPEGDFSVKYIGDGAETTKIQKNYNQKRLGKVEFTGRIPREKIIEHLKLADVFVMISESEILGLAYLEAMALGIIPIGSRNEGIDGIIVDGVNGFLCEAGNAEELASIMIKIRKMSREKLNAMSAKAKRTAVAFSDYNVAKQYIEGIVNNESN